MNISKENAKQIKASLVKPTSKAEPESDTHQLYSTNFNNTIGEGSSTVEGTTGARE